MGLLKLWNFKKKLKFTEKDGYIFCDLKNSGLTDDELKNADILVESMYSYLKEVAKSYSNFVKLKEIKDKF